jgi:hypothetical protein
MTTACQQRFEYFYFSKFDPTEDQKKKSLEPTTAKRRTYAHSFKINFDTTKLTLGFLLYVSYLDP